MGCVAWDEAMGAGLPEGRVAGGVHGGSGTEVHATSPATASASSHLLERW